MGAQELKTERLQLDRPVLADVAGVFAILGDPRTVEHNPSELLTDEVETAELWPGGPATGTNTASATGAPAAVVRIGSSAMSG